ncbi:MAG: D-alanyl-D-alanine carboxypeptidase [Oscillospiraceae bacterium]|nr:D-alanyl-D-alanine carboxypeptidase [Oscillospiraceae bacterium]
MKKLMTLLLVTVLLLSPFSIYSADAVEPSQIRARTAVLMDLETGQVIYDKGAHQRVYPASTTKILTALLVVENASLTDMMEVTGSAIGHLPWYGSHIALVEGEMISVDDALYAMMLPSANDASNVLAEHVAGSLDAFHQMMNDKAREIGALNSNFTNAHGLHEESHYTTAYDMALITRYAMENEDFRRYFGAPRHTMGPTNMNTGREWPNFQYMLVPGVDAYDPTVIGGKVGFTNAARHTMSTVATRDGRSLICVVMYAPTRWDKFNDTSTLLSFGFEEFIPITISGEEFSGFQLPVMQEGEVAGNATFDMTENFTALVHRSTDLDNLQIRPNSPDFYDYLDPTPFTVSFELPGSLPFVPSYLGSASLTPTIDILAVSASLHLTGDGRITPFWLRILQVIGIVLGVLILLFALFVVYRRIQIRKRRRRRTSRLAQKQAETTSHNFGTAKGYSPHAYMSSSFPRSNSGYSRRRVR